MQGIEIPIGAPLDRLDKDLKRAQNKLNNFADQAGKTGAALGTKLSAGSDKAAFALTNLGRVAQDAPFGFIGIQNNLNPLLDSFQRLKAETGSTGSAFKALGQSLIGPAGIGIALSVVSSAILFYQQYQQRANKETKQAVDANKELADSIKSISQVQAEGRANASKELSQLQSLYTATQNTNIPFKERLNIANELIKQNPKYLQGFSAEALIAGKAAVAYEKLTNAILAKGLAQAGEANRQKLVNKLLEDSTALVTAQTKLREAESKVKAGPTALPGLAAAQQAIQLSSEFNKAKNTVDALNKSIKDTNTQLALNDKVTQDLVKTYGSEVLFDSEKPKKLTQEVKTQSQILSDLATQFTVINSQIKGTFGDQNKERINALNDAIKELVKIKAPQSVIAQLQQQILNLDQSAFERTGKQVGLNFAVGLEKGLATTLPVVAVDLSTKLKTGLTDWQMYVNETLLPQLQRNFETFFNDILMRGKLSFESLGKAIVNTFLSALASDAAKELTNLFKISQDKDSTEAKKGGTGLLKGIASLFASKGAATAATTTATAGGTTATVAGGTAATGGVLLPVLAGLAVGATIASLVKKKPKAPVPQTSSTISTSAAQSFQDFGGGRVVFEISGTNLIGVLNRAGAKLQRFGP